MVTRRWPPMSTGTRPSATGPGGGRAAQRQGRVWSVFLVRNGDISGRARRAARRGRSGCGVSGAGEEEAEEGAAARGVGVFSAAEKHTVAAGGSSPGGRSDEGGAAGAAGAGRRLEAVV